MRILAAFACAALLGACGSSNPSHGLVTAPAIAVGGTTYSPGDGGGLAVNGTTCAMGLASIKVSALVAGFTSYKAVCDYVRANTICANKPNAWRASIAIIKGGSATPAPIGPGTYTITTGPPMPDPVTGDLTVVNVGFEDRNATCLNSSTVVGATGTVTIDQVTPTVKGSIAADLWDATPSIIGTISGPFEVDSCNAQVDICGQLAGTCTNLCI